MPMSPRWRRHGRIPYSANGEETLKIHRGMVIREIILDLHGQLTVAGANNTEANTLRGDEWALIRRIRLVANGTDVILDMDANAIFWSNLFNFQTPPLVSPDIGNAAVANPIFGPERATLTAQRQASQLLIPLWMPQARRPMDTALDARKLSDLVLEITWGSHLSINGTATGFTVNPYVDVFVSEVLGVSDDSKFASWRRFKIEQDITASSPDMEVQLPVNRMYRSFLLNTTDAGVDANDILNVIRLRNGPNEFVRIDAQSLQMWAQRRLGIHRPWDPVAEVFDPLQRSAQSLYSGWYYLDLVQDGLLSEAIDALGFTEFSLAFDVTIGAGATKLFIYPSTIIPIRG